MNKEAETCETACVQAASTTKGSSLNELTNVEDRGAQRHGMRDGGTSRELSVDVTFTVIEVVYFTSRTLRDASCASNS